MAEMDAHNPKASDLVYEATAAIKATPDKAPAVDADRKLTHL